MTKMVKEERDFSQSAQNGGPVHSRSDYLERDAASGDRKRDVERVLHDLSGEVQKNNNTARTFQRFHALRISTHSCLISSALFEVQMFVQ